MRECQAIKRDDKTVAALRGSYVLLKYVLSRDFPPLPDKLMGDYGTIKRNTMEGMTTSSNAPSTKLLPCIILLDPNGNYLGEVFGRDISNIDRLSSDLQDLQDKAKVSTP